MDGEMDSQMDELMNRQADRGTDRDTERQTDRHPPPTQRMDKWRDYRTDEHKYEKIKTEAGLNMHMGPAK